MPSIGQTHYRCGFDLKPKEGVAVSWGDVIRVVRDWISNLYPGTDDIGRKWFFTGADWKHPNATSTHIHVRTGIYKPAESAPVYWAVRFEHQCKEVSHRRWITDIGVTKIDGGSYRFLLHLYHRLSSSYIGPEPSQPVPTAPGVVSSLIRSRKFTPIAGCLELTDKPLTLSIGEGKHFYDLLRAENRFAPIILISPVNDTGQLLVDPMELARRLIGNAVVYVYTVVEVRNELDYFLEDKFRCCNGMVRIYQPKVNFGASDSRRHRFFLRDHILAAGKHAVYDQIATALNRRSRRWIGHGCESIEDVDSAVRRDRLAGFLGAPEDSQNKEILGLYEEENKQLTIERDGLRNRIDDLEISIEEYDEKLEGAQFRERQARTDATEARERARDAEVSLAAIRDIPNLPSSINEVVELIGRLLADRMVFTKEAHKSVKETRFTDVNVCWTCLWKMGTILYDLHFREELNSGEIVRQFKEQTGIDLVMTEGKQTKADTRLMSLRRVSHEGKEYDITPHVKLYSRNLDLRIHYAVDRERRRLVIGHCGDHLETYGTRKRKEG